ncbi:hypothetical protein CXG81DRAFT_8710 [Caulochytrium protostelioides]|uniref:Succinate dehydrogenase assembly factor 2, mitochondrial n=1 Tax=Caulochytrium protostelioides TaxID=1555241 RepID=A0A4V1ISW1_9FUNG|nr:DUF339-domain-containing protein [Caulochytrium protostelioides]RKP04091.1 hypothetical protein CXG81DRAFT_8710 [Caulochytrium protostelioides]|eukprot:RKP04091.1 hypothetical protein CXG81DRAFT_8710 [Caulochytrium protostelioides]
MRPSRPHETVAGARARLRWSSRKRGCLESDLILSTFADRHLASLSDAEVAQYDALLEENDWDIYYWATQAKPVPADMQNSVMTKLQAHARNEARSILRMPDLKAPPSSS